ncbi:MAG TPA: type II toxin-antitoxin system VapC family toxin [Gemmataceae bacterium]|nr:type II toxin-antitoxin system VapC family toxin [Gemmataceae bacterium]
MILLDTDTVSQLHRGHPTVLARVRAATDMAAITIISYVELLRGRWEFLLKAADGEQLQRAQQWLTWTQEQLASFPLVPINAAAAAEFDRLRQDKKLKRTGRADLLIAAIALANRATLVSRNLRDFQKVPGLHVENWADD